MAAERLRAYLEEKGIHAAVTGYPEPVETVEAAVRVAGVPPERIVKSLVVVDGEARPYVCQVPGHRRLSFPKARRVLGVDRLRLANPPEVLQATGYAIGAVPPLGYPKNLPVVIDWRIRGLDSIVAGGGSPSALVEIDPEAVRRATGARWADLS